MAGMAARPVRKSGSRTGLRSQWPPQKETTDHGPWVSRSRSFGTGGVWFHRPLSMVALKSVREKRRETPPMPPVHTYEFGAVAGELYPLSFFLPGGGSASGRGIGAVRTPYSRIHQSIHWPCF